MDSIEVQYGKSNNQCRGILVIDLGSQTTNLIARRIRALGVYAEVVPPTITLEQIRTFSPFGVILSGSPLSSIDAEHPEIDPALFTLGIPVLGICFGMFLLATYLGGTLREMVVKEYGPTELSIINSVSASENRLFDQIPRKHSLNVWMSHGWEIKGLQNADGTHTTASTRLCQHAAIENHSKNLYGLQFHPEVAHSEYGAQILANFVFNICHAIKNWNMEEWINQKLLQIEETIGNKRAICAVSGGVDSTTAAVLCSKVMQKKLFCIFIDTGLLRLNEVAEVEKRLALFNLNFYVINAKERFLSKLRGVTAPEEKRKIIGHEYIEVFKEQALAIQNVDYLIQGTIYSDKIESSNVATSSHISNIKSHHNVGGLPAKLGFKLYEPLDSLFKDEVRDIAKTLGLGEDIYNRHPSPGPGIALQIIGEVTEEKVRIVQRADEIVLEEIRRANLYNKIGEIFTNFTGIKTTGVKGDARVYEWLLALRSVDPSDLMTSNWSRLPYEVLSEISNRITNEIKGVNRVVYDITTKPPATIRWE